MKKYEVEIRETLSHTVEVEANSPQEARDKVQHQFLNTDNILDPDYYEGAKFIVKRQIRDRNDAR